MTINLPPDWKNVLTKKATLDFHSLMDYLQIWNHGLGVPPAKRKEFFETYMGEGVGALFRKLEEWKI